MEKLMMWVTERVSMGDIPRLNDLVEEAQRRGLKIKRSQLAQTLRLHPIYSENMPQQRQRLRSRKYRPIVINTLGYLHCDIGFFGKQEYETPMTFRAGFLVAKDVLSRFVYTSILRKDRKADSMIRAFEDIFAQHSRAHPSFPIQGISFDRETSVMSHKVQHYFKEKGIAFHAFEFSSSKAKMAEGAIKLIRAAVVRLMRRNNPKDRWWNVLPLAVESLNRQNIIIDGRNTNFTPASINKNNLQQFIAELKRIAPAYYFAQFDIHPDLASFKYQVGNFVRPKTGVVSSAVLGQKRSEQNLEKDVFIIESVIPYVTRSNGLGKNYRCRHLETGKIEVFEEHDLALSEPPSGYYNQGFI